MNNHVHILAKPKQANSLAKMMQGISQGYTKYINKRYKRTRRLWESRYYSCIVDKEEYLWEVSIYIEQNPKRIGIVDNEEDYPYSSAKAHILGKKNKVLSEELFEENNRNDYVEFLRERTPDKTIKYIRKTIKTGKPLGSNKFIKGLKKQKTPDFEKSVTCKLIK